MERDGAFTDALAGVLYELDTGRLATAQITSVITRRIVRWAHESGWPCRTEGRFDVDGGIAARDRQRLGFVDVLVHRGAPHADVAIEIDSADKPWSVVKLQHAAAAGMHAIWVRWGDDACAGIYDEVDVIQLPMLRPAQTPATSYQLSLW